MKMIIDNLNKDYFSDQIIKLIIQTSLSYDYWKL